MLIDDAQVQVTAAMNRGREQKSPVLIDGVEIDTADKWANESGTVVNDRSSDTQ